LSAVEFGHGIIALSAVKQHFGVQKIQQCLVMHRNELLNGQQAYMSIVYSYLSLAEICNMRKSSSCWPQN